MKNEAHFLVQGSAPDPYAVTFYLRDPHLSASCSCPAGQYGSHCKHRIAILSGDTSSIVSDNLEEVAIVAEWLKGSPLAGALAAYQAAERVLAKAKREMAKAKKRVTAVMVATP